MENNPRIQLKITSQNGPETWDSVYKRISWWDAERMAQARVLVVGAGALGNEVLKNLALLNVGHIVVVDFDHIEFSNLSRSILYRESDIGQQKSTVAAARIREINPNVRVKTIQGDIALDVGLGVFRRMDVVIGCLDNRVARQWINRHCFKTEKTWVDAAIENLAGQLDVYKPGISCYECQLTEIERENIRYRWGCADTAERNGTMGRIPTTPIVASIFGAMQVQEALKVIFGNAKQSMAGMGFKYEGMNNMAFHYSAEHPKAAHCESHAEMGDIIVAPELSCKNTVAETLAWLRQRLGCDNPQIRLLDEIVLELTAEQSGHSHPVLIPRLHLSEKKVRPFRRIEGEEVRISDSRRKIDHDFPHQTATLSELGIPPLDILTIITPDDVVFVELSGDESFLTFE